MSAPSDKPVVTRIAPSPTGMLHIGTARTALFNWLYARHTGGIFLLRIEDTDRERSTEEAVQVIFDSLSWLGLEPDAAPVFQHARADRHREAVQQLYDAGRAYRCYMTVEELEAERTRARAEGRAVRSPWRDREPPTGANLPFVLRFRGPKDGETIVHDLVKGPVTFANKELDDLVLLRSDGAPTYNLAVVVDDHDMGITHVIRGDDHLNNAARQSLIFEALGWEKPAFAHLPLIHGPDGAKLSKRHGAQAVSEFADMGYLPEAMRNYLARLGWGHGDDEIFSDAQAVDWFDVKNVVSAPARLDWQKLNFINGQYIRAADDDRLTRLTADVHRGRGVVVDETVLARAIPLVKDGAKTILDLADLTLFVLKHRPLTLDEKTLGLLGEETRALLSRLRENLAGETDWTHDVLARRLRVFAETEGVGMGKFGPALRGLLSGGAAAPDLASALAALAREESLGRFDDALSPSRQDAIKQSR
jgi:glutamyl-tRNA synthetase